MGSKLYKDLGLRYSVKYPGPSVQEYVRNHPKVKGSLMHLTSFTIKKEAQYLAGRVGIWGNAFHMLECFPGHGQLPAFRKAQRRKEPIAAIGLEATIFTIRGHLDRGL